MAKKKKKRKEQRPARSKKVRQGDPQKLLVQQGEALAEMRGRRAQVLGERIYAADSLDEAERRKALACGEEAYLRELLAKGHERQVQAKAEKLLGQYPWIADGWSLSLAVRLGAVQLDALEDASVMQRLRNELVDPADLAGEELGALGEQARNLLEAWAVLEERRGDDIRALLKRVGRRSPLVDWRLFLQVLSCLQLRNRAGAESAKQRMQEGTPAWAAAETALQEKVQRGFWSKKFEALAAFSEQGHVDSKYYPKVQSVVKRLLAEERPGLAGTVAAAFFDTVEDEYDFEQLGHMFEKLHTPGFGIERLTLRSLIADASANDTCTPEVYSFLSLIKWSLVEERYVWGRFFRDLRQYLAQLEREGSWELDEIREDMFELFIETCRRLAKRQQQEDVVYDFWMFMARELGASGVEAADAFSAAYPDDMAVQERVIRLQGNEGDLQALQKVEQRVLACSTDDRRPVEQLLLFQKIIAAFKAGDGPAVASLAAEHDSDNIEERIQVMIMQWQTAKGVEKRRLGVSLAELNTPFMVAYYACVLVPSLGYGNLSAALKRSFENDFEAVFRSYLQWEALQSGVDMFPEYRMVNTAFLKALRGYDGPLSLIKPVLSSLLLKMTMVNELLYESDGLCLLFGQLLDGSNDDVAVALALRPMLTPSWTSVAPSKAERTYRVAWTLAESDEVRQLIETSYKACDFYDDEMNKKPATEKMLEDELKMQRRFKSFDQVGKRYGHKLGTPIVPHGGMRGLGAVTKALEKVINDLNDEMEDEMEDDREDEEYQRPSRPFDFGAFVPRMEFEFEQLITSVEQETAGGHRRDAVEKLLSMIADVQLSDKAKKRLRRKCQFLIEGA